MLKFMREHVKWIMITVILLFVLSCFGGYGLYVRGNRNRQANNGQMQIGRASCRERV